MGIFTNKVVAITGGSSGIGLATAQRFVSENAQVAIFGRSQQKLEAASNLMPSVLAVRGDVCKVSDLDRFYHEVQNKFGKLDVLVANAGISNLRSVHEVDEAFFDEIVNTNFKGVYFSVQRALPFLNANSAIILISSIAAHLGWPRHSVYSAAKAAVSHLAHCLASDLLPQGIRVNVISPGFVDTPIFESMQITPEKKQKRVENIPARRFALPEEIANAVLFFASSEASYINGVDLLVDGGMTAIYPARL